MICGVAKPSDFDEHVQPLAHYKTPCPSSAPIEERLRAEMVRILGTDTLLFGPGLPDDNPHSPNEKFDLECFERGMGMGALLWQELAG